MGNRKESTCKILPLFVLNTKRTLFGLLKYNSVEVFR